MYIQIVEDDLVLGRAIQKACARQGWKADVLVSFQEACKKLKAETDLFILDVHLPDGTGLDLCQKIREFSQQPVLFLSSDDAEMTIQKGYALMADDYIEKPVRLNVLISKCQALIRRSGMISGQKKLGEYRLDEEEQLLYFRDNQPLSLTAVDTSLLTNLFKMKGKLVSREQLCAGMNTLSDETLTVRMSELRRKIPESFRIECVRGSGYRWKM